MKKILLTVLLISACFISHAEKKVSEYYSGYYRETFDIKATDVKDGNFKFYINCHSVDSHQPVGFSLLSEDVPLFIIALSGIKDKYSEWSEVAKKNGVIDYDKYFEIPFPKVNAFFKYGRDWYFRFNFELKPYFKVTKSGKCLVVFNSGKLISTNDPYIDVDGFNLIFCTVDEIDEFIKALDISNVLEKSIADKEIDALFQ